jgi:hypothetical protein
MSARCQFKLQGRHARCWLGAPRCPPPERDATPLEPRQRAPARSSPANHRLLFQLRLRLSRLVQSDHLDLDPYWLGCM